MTRPASAINTSGPLTNLRKDRIMAKANITAERLRELLHYDPETGIFTWIPDSSTYRNTRLVTAGFIASSGYHIIKISETAFKAHRLAWMYAYGSLPVGVIDHINGIKSDNRIANLRDVTSTTNLENQKTAHSNNKLGLLGVTRFRKRYAAHIRINKILYFLGSFATPELAHAAYLAAKRERHEGCTI